MALMTTSGSIPFSFASASIVCCRGFDILKFHFQIRARNHSDRHPVAAIVVADNNDDVPAAIVVFLEPAKPALEEHLTVYRLAHHQLGSPSREAAVIGRVPQGAV